ncbi:unnamed protein product [Notodromas monacha]|uniref:RNA helicase n=1 Tax=Notodromas monacha TaxID=399045 RepID=A0A7R9GCD5_9CRUS|nr:unnamed protein product [Notodromas monacha]CAG0917556.1 unnamed protein product [Notodromas monacha]
MSPGVRHFERPQSIHGFDSAMGSGIIGIPRDGNLGKLNAERQHLPIFSARSALLEQIEKNDNVIVVAETGSGKTTQIPQYILESKLNKRLRIGVTQPRRVAAISVAERVAQEKSCEVGQLVGYSVRFQEKVCPATKIKYMTDGMLVREAILDKMLKAYSFIILDEVHERSLHTDIVMGIVYRAQQLRKCDGVAGPLKTVTMSATMDAEAFSNFWNGAPMLYVQGREHPVDYLFSAQKVNDYVLGCLSTCIQLHKECPLPEGILIFLTGQEEIEEAVASLRNAMKESNNNLKPAVVSPLYAALPDHMQREALKPAPPGKRKIVVATNVAEASLTIAGIKHVIDSGCAKIKEFEPRTGLETLAVRKISRAQCEQRAGRAGRLGPGSCRVMLTREEWTSQPALPEPELLRCNLAGVTLQLLAAEVPSLVSFRLVNAPPRAAVRSALRQLWLLDAVLLDDLRRCHGATLTPLGYHMSRFPLDPRFSKLLCDAAKQGCSADVITIVSLLSAEQLFTSRRINSGANGGGSANDDGDAVAARRAKFESVHGDLPTYLRVFGHYRSVLKNCKKNAFGNASSSPQHFCDEHGLSYRALSYAWEVRLQLRQLAESNDLWNNTNNGNEERLSQVLSEALFMNCAERQVDGSYAVVGTGETVRIHPSSVLFRRNPDCVLFVELVETSSKYMRHVTRIDRQLVEPKLSRIRQVIQATISSKRQQQPA